MSDAVAFAAIWYVVLALVTMAMTLSWPGQIRLFRAVALWPAFWAVVICSALKRKRKRKP